MRRFLCLLAFAVLIAARPAADSAAIDQAFKQFFADLAGGEKNHARFENSDYRLSAAALLVHAATIDGEMSAVERDNPSLKGVLPKDYARPTLDKTRLGQLIDLISNISFTSPRPSGEGSGVRKLRQRATTPRTCSAASMSISSPSSPVPRARREASSIRRAAWSSC